MTTDEFALHDAAYVLGALSQADRREFEDHLKWPDRCDASAHDVVWSWAQLPARPPA